MMVTLGIGFSKKSAGKQDHHFQQQQQHLHRQSKLEITEENCTKERRGENYYFHSKLFHKSKKTLGHRKVVEIKKEKGTTVKSKSAFLLSSCLSVPVSTTWHLELSFPFAQLSLFLYYRRTPPADRKIASAENEQSTFFACACLLASLPVCVFTSSVRHYRNSQKTEQKKRGNPATVCVFCLSGDCSFSFSLFSLFPPLQCKMFCYLLFYSAHRLRR